MSSGRTVLVVGAASAWPASLPEWLRRLGLSARFVPSARELPIAGPEIRAVLVDGRRLSLGDLVSLRKLRGGSPHLDLIVVGSDVDRDTMKHALDSDATAFVEHTQIEAMLPEVLAGRSR